MIGNTHLGVYFGGTHSIDIVISGQRAELGRRERLESAESACMGHGDAGPASRIPGSGNLERRFVRDGDRVTMRPLKYQSSLSFVRVKVARTHVERAF